MNVVKSVILEFVVILLKCALECLEGCHQTHQFILNGNNLNPLLKMNNFGLKIMAVPNLNMDLFVRSVYKLG